MKLQQGNYLTHQHQKKVILAIALVNLLVLGGVVGVVYYSYQIYLDSQKSRLYEMVHNQVAMISSVAEFDRKYSQHDVEGGAVGATLQQLKEADLRYTSLGKSGEFVLARKVGDSIELLLRHQTSKENHSQSANLMPDTSEVLTPMQRALRGESGTIIGRDYRGVKVLAAYRPVGGGPKQVMSRLMFRCNGARNSRSLRCDSATS